MDYTEQMTTEATLCSPPRYFYTPTKKIKNADEICFNGTNNNSTSPVAVRYDSGFPSYQTQELPLDKFVASVKRRNQPANTNNNELFTLDQVKEIVGRAVAEREAALKHEYEQILYEKLQEQFRNFAKFNEDYISRQLKQSDFSYLS